MTEPFLIRPEILDGDRRRRAVEGLRAAQVTLPSWSELADPARIPAAIVSSLKSVGPDEPDAKNLWRVHWFNDVGRRDRVPVPGYVVLPETLTGVKAPVVVLLGRRFPMIGAHKVLAAYACLVPRLVTGQFEPTHDRAVWLQEWVSDPGDIIRTPGTESNVKEIYDKCDELARDEHNVILNQFSEFANYLIHYHCTGAAFDRVFAHLKRAKADCRLAAFVSATGSAGTIAAGDYLKARHSTKIAAVEAIECPTMLCNGYGEHNIQGIGDKHIPLIHNVMNTDLVVGVSDLTTDSLNLLFGGNVGRSYLAGRRKIDPDVVRTFDDIGISGLANIVAAIKIAKHLDFGADDVVMTVATDSALLYASERRSFLARRYGDGFDEVNAGEIFSRHLEGIVDDHVLELTHFDRKRIFNLGYYTWVEQQGVAIDDFDRRRDQRFWRGLVDGIPTWDRLIEDFNAEVGARRAS